MFCCTLIRCLAIFFLTAVLTACGGGGNSLHSTEPVFDEVTWKEYESPILTEGVIGQWNAGKGDTGNSILQFEGTFYLFHSGQDSDFINQIGLSTSSSGNLYGPWLTLSSPIFRPGEPDSWDEIGVAHPSVIRYLGEWLMYYSGLGSSGQWSIGVATSANGLKFTRSTIEPVLSVGATGEWDSAGVDHPSVIYDAAGDLFVMAYRGWAGGEGFTDTHSQIGIATSKDGVHWVKSAANPILRWGAIDTWDEHGLLAPRLFKSDNTYHLNYSGKSNGITSKSASSIGHASSPNLLDWVKSHNNPLIYAGATKWTEIEWGTPIWNGSCWSLLATAWAEQGKTVLFEGVCR